MTDLIDSYSESYYSAAVNLNILHPSADAAKFSAGGQSFTMLATNHKITSCKFYIRKIGSPTGNCYAVLYAHSGTYGVNGVPTGAALATSNAKDVSTLPTSISLVEFIFSGAQQYEMVANVKYCIAFLNPTAGTIDTINYVRLGYDSGAGHSGNLFFYRNSAWIAQVGDDGCFYVYGDPLINHWTKTIAEKMGFVDGHGADKCKKCKPSSVIVTF